MTGRPASPGYYFVRANGATDHGNPNGKWPIPDEPPGDGRKQFNHLPYCLRHGIARIGWPDVGDLRHVPAKVNALATWYDFSSRPVYVQNYLRAFRDIAPGSVVLVPDRDRPGVLVIGQVTAGYDYFHAPPEHPYECAHRVKVKWDRRHGDIVEYAAADLGISIHGGFWRKAFHRIDRAQRSEMVRRIETSREMNPGSS